jgi:hypothetical protein
MKTATATSGIETKSSGRNAVAAGGVGQSALENEGPFL